MWARDSDQKGGAITHYWRRTRHPQCLAVLHGCHAKKGTVHSVQIAPLQHSGGPPEPGGRAYRKASGPAANTRCRRLVLLFFTCT